jgi:aminoglycoside phosphotransferase family enzyme
MIASKVAGRVDSFLQSDRAYRLVNKKWGEGTTAYSPHATTVTTHCARIYLLGDVVLKIKLPVAYSYIDLSTLSKRYLCLKREFNINHKTLPSVYLGLVGVIADENHSLRVMEECEIEDRTTVVEWCLLMKRFNEDDILVNVARDNRFSSEHAEALGREIASYHQAADVVPVEDGAARLSEIIDELSAEFAKLDGVIPKTETDLFIEPGIRACRQQRKLLQQRGETGFVRACHGDLHLKNIVLIDSTPAPFDALEFDERLRTIDIFYDLAFLLMDLDHFFLYEQTNTVLNKYLLMSAPVHIEGLQLLSLFMYCRAGIRAMTVLQGAETSSHQSEARIKEARLYLHQGRRYLNKKYPAIICIGGFSGSGKSTIARRLVNEVCAAPGALLIRSDSERKALFGVEETDDLGADHYTGENSDAVYDTVYTRVAIAAQAGYPTIVDATFLDEHRRLEMEVLAASMQVDFYGFWLMAPVSTMIDRIEKRTADASDADVSVLYKQLRYDKGRIDWYPVDTSPPVEVIIRKIVDRIRESS